MRILGIDPGLLNLGCFLLEVDNGQGRGIEGKTFKTNPKQPLSKRLFQLYTLLRDYLEEKKPDFIATEEPLAKSNSYMTAKVYQAQALVLLLAEEKGIPLKIFHPSYWKNFLCGNGRASKEDILTFFTKLFREENLKDKIQDEHMGDALALALVCALELKIL